MEINRCESLQLFNIINLCRICLVERDKMFLLTSQDISPMIVECASVLNNCNAKLPQRICRNCLTELQNYYNFKVKCATSMQTLLEVIENELNSSLKIEDEEIKPINFDNYTPEPADDSCSLKSESIENGFVSEADEDVKEPADEFPIESEAAAQQKQKSVAALLIKKYNIYDLTCNICQKNLSNRFSMLRHMEVHDQNRSLKFQCKICNKGFYAAENLKKHEIRHLGKTKYECEKCSKRFYVLSALGVHCKSRHKAQPLKCSKCSLEFYHQLQLDQHLPTHEEKRYVCSDCGKIFPTRNRLTKHLKIHSEERPYKCNMCESAFKQKFNLTIHQRLRHLETDRRDMCNICGKLFHPGSLRAHLETHNTDIIHKCDQCGKIYANRLILGKHKNEKHKLNGGTELKKYFCNVCNKMLGSSSSLRKHLITVHATVEKCDCHICGKSYKSQNGVKAHILSAHMDQRPHVCQVCNKAFHSKNVLQKHMRTHTGERPFNCSICGKSFGFRNVLKTHMKVHEK